MKKIIRMTSVLCVMVIFLLTLVSCGNNVKNYDNPKEFVIAYLPNEGDRQLADYRKGFSDDLSKALHIPVKEYFATDYNAVIEALRFGHADMALLGVLNIFQADERSTIEPLAMVAEGGSKETAGYYSYLVTNSNKTDINTINDIKGLRIAWVDPNSSSGNLFPSADIILAFPELSLTMDDLHIDGRFFDSVIYSGRHIAGLYALQNYDVDLVPCASDTFFNEIVSGRMNMADFKIIHQTPKIPSSAFVINSKFSAEFKNKVLDFLINYDNEDYFEYCLWDITAKFVQTSMDDYVEFKKIADLILKG